MSLRSKKPSEQQAARFSQWTHRAATDGRFAPSVKEATPTDSWWGRRQVQRQQPLPRLQLYAFDPSQANDELYAFVYDRKEVRYFYAQSRNDGQRMGELEAVEGYGRADIMAITWTRKGGADFELRFIGRDDLSLAEGYVIKTDVNDRLAWVIKLTRLYGEHIRALTSKTLLSLPVYTALATGLKFGLDDPKANDYLGLRSETAEETPPATTEAIADGMSNLSMASADIGIAPMPSSVPKGALPPPLQQSGPLRTFNSYPGDGPIKGGDKWCVVRPWDTNQAIVGVARYEQFQPIVDPGKPIKTAMRCIPQVKDAPVGVIFPTRGRPIIDDGRFVHSIEVEATPIDSALGASTATGLSVYRAYLYNNNMDDVMGVVDIVPDAKHDAVSDTIKASRFIATPTMGKPWIGLERGTSVVVTDEDVRRCREGEVAPWSMDVMCVIEAAMFKLATGV